MKITIKRELNCLDISKLASYRALIKSVELNDFIIYLLGNTQLCHPFLQEIAIFPGRLEFCA